MHRLEFKNIFSAIENYDTVLLDIWGVIIEGSLIYPGVVDAINRLSKKRQVYFVSNAPRPAVILCKMLESWGVETTVDRVFCSGEMTRNLLSTINKPIIYHLGMDHNHDILSSTNYESTNDITKANILLLTLHREEAEYLDEFDVLLKQAIALKITNICANPDIFIPNEGKIKYGPGYFARKIEEFGGKVIYTGKPYIPIFEAAIANIPSIPKNRILMVGDSFETDIKGAKNAGIHSALVFTGNAYKLHNQYIEIEDKLTHLTTIAQNLDLMPNFVTEIK